MQSEQSPTKRKLVTGKNVLLVVALSATLVAAAIVAGRRNGPPSGSGGGKGAHPPGFTLIEMAIVLVIIGLIVGGVLVGQSLIGAAAVRAQISQIEQFQTAKNTFYGKYGGLPGDLNATAAIQFGFIARSGQAGQGDGNGVVEGFTWNYCCSPDNGGNQIASGETGMFWEDLSAASLIDGTFNTAAPNHWPTSVSPTVVTATTNPAIGAYLPTATIGRGNYIYVWSGGSGNNGLNYFGLSLVNTIYPGTPNGPPGLTISEANGIDKKMDDGLPQSGSVTAIYLNGTNSDSNPQWANGPDFTGPYTTATPGSSTSCFDNGNVAGATQQYSVEISNGSNVNCALSFQFQ